jgi:hypothetical protein
MTHKKHKSPKPLKIRHHDSSSPLGEEAESILKDIDLRLAEVILVHPQQRRKFVSDDEKLAYIEANPI